MAIFTVHSKETSPEALVGRAADIVFVKEGFTWPGFFLTWVWLVYKRMWLVLLMVFGYELILLAIDAALDLGPLALIPAGLAVNFILGLEGADLYRWTLGLRGYREVGVESGNVLEEAEYRFFADLPAAAPPVASNSNGLAPLGAYEADALGLFSPPGNV
jgi:hypothetical protein